MTTDAELLRESRRRPDAYVEVCERHIGDLATWLRKQVGANEADELLAETLARGWYARKRFRDPGTGSAGPWMQGIAGNVVREFRRRGVVESRAREKLGLASSVEMSSEADIDARLTAERDFASITSAFRDLPVGQRIALRLRVVEKMDYDEIGVQQGVPATTARTRVHRALKTLRLTLNGDEQ
jgi:RNA polymerase sigma-70 factor, ECF subfamily